MIRSAAIYFAVVFGAGFAFGVIREILLSPIVGGRTAELIEFPLMLVVILATAGWITRRERRLANVTQWLTVGTLAASVVLIADLAVGLFVRGMTLRAVTLERDSVTGVIYYLMVMTFAISPFLFASFRGRKHSHHSDRSEL